MKYWITTDTHFNHRKIIEFCGRPNNYEDLISRGLFRIPYGDTLIHLGDVCMGQDEKMHNTFIRPISAKKILVLGNHDRKSVSWYLEHGWDFVVDKFGLKMFGKKILFSHKPQPHDGWYDINLHGHFHNTDHRTHEPELVEIKNSKQILLALEYEGYEPLELEKLLTRF